MSPEEDTATNIDDVMSSSVVLVSMDTSIVWVISIWREFLSEIVSWNFWIDQYKQAETWWETWGLIVFTYQFKSLILRTTRKAIEESQQDILSVREVSQAHLSRAKTAYLFACSTAQNQTIELSDEVLHVVSEFQIAGFRHVVDCLLPSDDKVCLEVVKSFYFELCQGRVARFNVDGAAALALHKAIVKVRESKEYCKRSLLWAQYVVLGHEWQRD